MATRKTTTQDTIDLMNSIRASDVRIQNAGIPVATDENIAEVASGYLQYPETRGYFMSALINRIGLTVLKGTRFNNPFKRLRKSDVKVGETIQEIFVKLCEEKSYDYDSQTLLATEKPNVDALYFLLNRKKYYKQSVPEDEWRQYFVSWETVGDFIAEVIANMTTSDENDEYDYCLQAINQYMVKDLFYKVHMDEVTDTTTGDNVIKQLQAMAKKLTFISDKYNARRNQTAVREDDLVLFLTADMEAELSVYVQSKAFNLEKVEYLKNRIVVDGFKDPTVKMVLTSTDWLGLRNYLVKTGAFYNPETLSTNYYYHHWEYIYTSQLEPAIAFTTETVETDSVSSVAVSPANVTMPKGGSLTFMPVVTATGNATKNVTWQVTGGTSQSTYITQAGELVIGTDETVSSLTVKAVSDFDNATEGEATVTVE